MARRKRPKEFRDVSIYFRDQNKVWRKIENVLVALEYDTPITIYQTDFENRNKQLFLKQD